MSDVTITTTESQVRVHSPYNPAFPDEAKKLGGKWQADSKAWVFDARDESRVRELCREVYGTDGSDDGDQVTLKITIHDEIGARHQALYFAGRQVARAWGRDSGARLGEGVVVLEGGFGSGGSVKNWRTKARAGTVFELRDVPRPAAEKEIENYAQDNNVDIKIIDETIDRDALLSERERLMTRIQEIDNLINA